MAPSPVAFQGRSPVPAEVTLQEIDDVASQFRAAAKRSLQAGFEVLELHMAHGYLLHEFLSPLSNHRKDDFGGPLENRWRFPLMVTENVREVWPESLPLFVRISCTDWVEGGWDLGQSIDFCGRLKDLGVDLIDCSSGGLVPDAVIPAGPGYHTPFSAAIRREAAIPTGAVGYITEPAQAEQIIATGRADVVLMAREMLRRPYWPLHAARALNVDIPWPVQYRRAR